MIFVSEEDLEQVILAITEGDYQDAICLLREIIEEENLNPN